MIQRRGVTGVSFFQSLKGKKEAIQSFDKANSIDQRNAEVDSLEKALDIDRRAQLPGTQKALPSSSSAEIPRPGLLCLCRKNWYELKPEGTMCPA